MNKKLLEAIMKYPFQFLFTCIALFMVFPFSIWILNYQKAIQLGFVGIVGMGVLFGGFVILLWWLASWIVLDLVYKGRRENTIHYDESVKTWRINILFGSIVGTGWSVISLIICYTLSWRFKVYFIITLSIPIVRILYYLLEKRLYKNENLRDTFKLDE